uniref:DDE Tnp4 domain-containing protein n=1 Tax=Ditylenchus dipsaci TaxID=166011 RepID=A0A915EBT1_9BILA
MENFELEEAIGWWALRKKRSYVRPAHYKSALHRNSFAVFWRYYSSPDEGDLKRFIAFGPTYSAVASLFMIGDSTVHDICKEKFYSIVLLAIADAESRFLMVDVGASGRDSDSTLWISSPLRNFLGSPEAALPPNEEGSLPFIFLGDGGFGCTDLVLTPFTDRGADSQEKIAFNGRLSRAKSAVEHAFGIFAKRWRIFFKQSKSGKPETARLYTLAAVILHNFPRDPVEEEDLNLRFPDDRRMLIDQRAPEAGRQGRLIRDRFVDVVIRSCKILNQEQRRSRLTIGVSKVANRTTTFFFIISHSHILPEILLKIIRPTLDNPPEQTSLLSLPLLKECTELQLLIFKSDCRDEGLLLLPQIVDWLHQYSFPPIHRSIRIFASGESGIVLSNYTVEDVVEELKMIFESTTQRCHFRISFEIELERLGKKSMSLLSAMQSSRNSWR